MLVAKHNWAMILRITGQWELHRRVCKDLLAEWKKAEYGEGVLKTLRSLTMALGPQPLPEQAREIRDLLVSNYSLIQKGDGILLSEVLSDIAALSLIGIEDQSSPEFGEALDRAILWLNRAMSLLPPTAGSNHALIHQRLADCYLRKSMASDMDENFQSAIAIFERLGEFDLAAFCAASAADGWLFFRNRDRAGEYAEVAAHYISQAKDSPAARAALQILKQL